MVVPIRLANSTWLGRFMATREPGALWPITTPLSVGLIVVSWGLLLLVEIREIVLDPKLCAGLLNESFHGSAAREGLVPVELKRRSLIRVALFLVVVQVAREKYGP